MAIRGQDFSWGGGAKASEASPTRGSGGGAPGGGLGGGAPLWGG